ncbi:PorT family protein [Flavobacterium agricola]|uniref:PorT family protein n=1 Tax=Flavobacterium agricola TaxID=2870839 RepID=A0ABY6M2B0_9FLAO|nr:porin family protein [Flavobacterium agricola]UYW01251.1 PorT family protein [Flavobacterium agricola]
MVKKLLQFGFLLFSVFALHAQEPIIIENPVDSLYREDQFYVNVSYSMMQNKPSGYKQRGYFSNFSFGFLRDFPLNKQRNIAIAPGFGYTYSHLKSNLLILPEDAIAGASTNGSQFEVLPIASSRRNNMQYHTIDVPIEFRWRTSTPESHKFFRVYAGLKFSYIFADKSVYEEGAVHYKVKNIDNLNRFQTGIYLAAGYNTWNAYAYYGLTPLFKSSATNPEPIKLNALHVGLIFYIL